MPLTNRESPKINQLYSITLDNYTLGNKVVLIHCLVTTPAK